MTAIIRLPPGSQMSGLIASHAYPDLSQHPHLRPHLPSSHLSNQMPPMTTAQNYTNEKSSTADMTRSMANGASNDSRVSNGAVAAPHQAVYQPPPVTTQQQREQQYQNNNAAHQNNSHHIQHQQPPRPRSPIEEVSPKHVEFKQEPDMYQADSTEQIAPYLQIPLEINSSKGSLSDFAAQITCLFWFESSQTLLRVEEARSTPIPIQPLIPEATPTIGFRKWVTTILSTTQVSTNVVLLALMFVYRLKKMNPTVKGKPGSEYRLLTVALMLGNKFLDDNTYTNKTWGEVSGITVNEIHVMEVEFLSNMRYTLYASKEEWQLWLQKLRRFAEYFDAASKAAEDLQRALIQPQYPGTPPVPVQNMHPTTPSRMYAGLVKPLGNPPTRPMHPLAMPLYPNQINPAPVSRMPEVDLKPTSRKRSYDDSGDERAAKRLSRSMVTNTRPDAISPAPSLASGTTAYTDQTTPRTISPYGDISTPRGATFADQTPRLPLPIMNGQQMLPQLPMGYSHHPQAQLTRAMASVYHPTGQANLEPLKPQPQPQSQGPIQAHTPLNLRIPLSMDTSQPISATASRNNSPHTAIMTPTGEQLLSPMVYGHYRSSPYKPVRTVNSLLAPPPSTSLGNPANGIGSSDLQYRPLAKQPLQNRVGVVPHIPQAYPNYPWPVQNQGY